MLDFFNFFFQKPIKILVVITFLFAVFSLSRRNSVHKYLILILLVCSLTEVVNSIIIFNNKSIVFSSTIGMILHHILWLIILEKKIYFKTVFYVLLISFIVFAAVNLFFIYGINRFNSYTFVIGAFIYILIFIYESFYKLKHENFSYFFSNSYLLIFSPVLLFLGLSFYFGFKDSALGEINVLSSIKLYDMIAYFANIIYYTLINIYIYRERKLKHA